ncbi:MAG TPA: MBL fold metallo-hydrolase [Steroidobacteraceae bacterium]|nr:MBL fold metallo-hydrolase [Steroidobacteraceae bacterium]
MLLLVVGISPKALAASAADPEAAVAVLPVVPGIDMLTVDGVNVAVDSGPDGVIVVDAGPASTAPQLLAAIKNMTSLPIRYVIDTSGDPDLIGGDAVLVAAGQSLITDPGTLRLSPRNVADAHVGRYAPIVATQEVLERMIQQGGYPSWALPSEVFDRPEYQFYMNRQAIAVIREPAAHSDGDAVVRFERSDVVVAGDIFDIEHFPVIDVEHGGSIQGELDALNQLLNTLVFTSTPIVEDAVGTVVIPVHGPVCNQADILTYRDMVANVRNRIEYLIDHGKTLKQVEAADPTQGYASRYGEGSAATAFVDAAYKSLMASRSHGHAAKE